MKDAGGAGAVDARLALGAGEQPSIHRDRPDRPGTQGVVIFSGRQHRGSCRAGAGAVPASLHITTLVSRAGSILHDRPGTKQSLFSRAVRGSRGHADFWLLGWRNGAQGVAGGDFMGRRRPARSGASPEARLTLPSIPKRQSACLSVIRPRCGRQSGAFRGSRGHALYSLLAGSV